MKYFNPEFISFFKELSKNNNTDWFNENRKTYEKEVKKPFSDFVQEMITKIHEIDADVKIKPSEAITRINKDIRFSKDKIPYNTYVGAIISATGKKDKSYPGIYLQFSHEKIMIFGGSYMIETESLQKIRYYISNNLKDFSAAYNDKNFIEKFGTIKGEKSKRIPEEFRAIEPLEPLIANKQYYFMAELNADLLTKNELSNKIINYYLAGKKLNDFLKKAITNAL